MPPAAPRTATLRAGVEPDAAAAEAAAAEAEKRLAASLANCGSRDIFFLFLLRQSKGKREESEKVATAGGRDKKIERRGALRHFTLHSFALLGRALTSRLLPTPFRIERGGIESDANTQLETLNKQEGKTKACFFSFFRLSLAADVFSKFKCRLAEEEELLQPLPLDPHRLIRRLLLLPSISIISTIIMLAAAAMAWSPSTAPASSTGAPRPSSPLRRLPMGARSPRRGRTEAWSCGRPRGGAACW